MLYNHVRYVEHLGLMDSHQRFVKRGRCPCDGSGGGGGGGPKFIRCIGKFPLKNKTKIIDYFCKWPRDYCWDFTRIIIIVKSWRSSRWHTHHDWCIWLHHIWWCRGIRWHSIIHSPCLHLLILFIIVYHSMRKIVKIGCWRWWQWFI